jgi:hypothetical protein
MSSYSHYQTYQAPEGEQQVSQSLNSSNRGPATQVTLRDGEYVRSERPNGSYQTANMGAETFGADDWRAHARSAGGIPTTTITRDGFVTIGGVQGRVETFINMGVLREVAPGVIEEVSQGAPQEAPQDSPARGPQQAADADAAVMPDEVANALNTALEPVPDHALGPLVNDAIGVALGKGDVGEVARSLAQAAGIPDADALPRVEFMIQNYQAQADAFLTSRVGVPPESLQHFYEYARSKPEAMADAMRQQAFGSTMASWRKLASKYLAEVAPPEVNLQRAGIETRKGTGGRVEVHIGHGIWTDIQTATALGYV